MKSYQRLIIHAKDKFLKKDNFYVCLIFVLFFSISFQAYSEESKSKIIDYTKNLANFSAKFIQSNGKTIEEGVLYIGETRVRIDYLKPSKISITMDKDKAMYINYDLDEVQYFNPEKSEASIFFEILKNEEFFADSNISTKDNNFLVKKKYSTNNINYNANLIFENKPFVLRKINLEYDGAYYSINFFNHNFNESFDKKFFSLANPFLKN